MKQLLLFKAAWCQPCKSLSEVIRGTELPDVDVVVYDVDQNPLMAAQHKVRGVPTLILVDEHGELRRTTGFQGPNKLVEFCTT